MALQGPTIQPSGVKMEEENDLHGRMNSLNLNCNSVAPGGGPERRHRLIAPPASKCMGRYDVELGEVTKHNVMQLKRLNQSVFPVSYNEKFYKDVLTSGNLSKLAYFNDIVVGGVCCRVDSRENENTKAVYIMTLGALAPYRRYGVGTMLLRHVLDICEADPHIKSVYLHVQTNNDSALDFYKRFEFRVTGTAEQYYKRIEPDSAYILERAVNQ